MDATLFVSNRSWHRTLPVSPGIFCIGKDTVLTSTKTLGVPLSFQGLCVGRGETKPITNDSFIEDDQTKFYGGLYSTKLAILNISLPHTLVINLGQIKHTSYWAVCEKPPIIASISSLPLKVRTPIKKCPSNYRAYRCHHHSSFLPSFYYIPITNHQGSNVQCY